MTLGLGSEEADRLARSLAELTGDSLTDAVVVASGSDSTGSELGWTCTDA